MRKTQIGDVAMNSRELYRDPINGKLSGVCAGIANYLAIEVWLIRILVISAALLGGSFLVILAYVALTFMLEKQPIQYQEDLKMRHDHKLKAKPWQQGQTAESLLAILEADFNRIENKVRDMEAYVTSDTFKVNREFNKL
ncbi:envelope stress response membrane protein PspC [Vibrio vulnificus]|uniref:envelope stress response membrane protein PspC n=1 Tax=Vibrio TaxID=662 RepID=UPI0009B89CBC|nr:MULTISPECIES: envelope stress response membrane protein PspC [Vibrio]EHY1012180.1 envelope stress response membrane protein PspC [Vibrio vulnificus]EHY1119263.1 envelope stress response membrane protein PspC [Vibrio vulnificus]EID4422215.1 envelope stress response membrane protein PspC [Vibrio vulnificus]EIO3936558.1 envelope stress response membrane protein PspC [Vibrio vulnificus]EJR3606474.1 envelope stress response membrane protein PspC [Vibrio vulnificus]